MRCPKCHHNSSRVIDSRQTDDGGPFAVVVNVKTVAFVLPPLNELKKRLYLSSKKTVSGKNLVEIKSYEG